MFASAMRSSVGCQRGTFVVMSVLRPDRAACPRSPGPATFENPQRLGDSIRQRYGAPARKVDPDNLRRAVGEFAPVVPDLVEAAHARAPGIAEIHLHFEVAGIDERRRERAARIDDDGSRSTRVGAALWIECVRPFDPRLLHVLE